MPAKIKNRFPKKELNAWLRVYQTWDHIEWLNLLENLTKLGFHEWSTSVRTKRNWVLSGNKTTLKKHVKRDVIL